MNETNKLTSVCRRNNVKNLVNVLLVVVVVDVVLVDLIPQVIVILPPGQNSLSKYSDQTHLRAPRV